MHVLISTVSAHIVVVAIIYVRVAPTGRIHNPPEARRIELCLCLEPWRFTMLTNDNPSYPDAPIRVYSMKRLKISEDGRTVIQASSVWFHGVH